MRRKKIALIVFSSLVAIIALAIVLAPSIVGGIARGRIEQALGERLEGSVSVGDVALAWFGPQKVTALAVDGGDERGTISLDATVDQGLLALAQGSDISLVLGGRVATRFDEDGRIGLARLPKPTTPGADQASSAAGGDPLGGRTLRVKFDGVSFAATGPDGAQYAIDRLDGNAVLSALQLDLALDAVTKSGGRAGELSIDGTLRLALAGDGAVDLARTTGNAVVSASKLAWPTKAGELSLSRLKLDLAKEASGNIKVAVDAVARLGRNPEGTVKADIVIAEAFGADGRFSIDPSDIAATIDARGVPMAALQPFAPEIAPGVSLDLVRDIGDSADLAVSKQAGNRARIALESRQVGLTFDGAVAPDGSSIDGGSIVARVGLAPELLRSLGLVEPGTLDLSLRGEGIVWRKSDDPVRAFGGSVSAELTKPFDFSIERLPTRIRANTLAASVAKKPGESTARAEIAASARYGATGDTTLAASGELDLASRALASATLSAQMRIDPAFVERITDGGVSARGTAASLKLSVPELAYIPSAEYSGLRALVARAKVELAGAVAVEAAGRTAAINDLSIELATPRGSKRGTLAVGARVDGASVRIDEEFGQFPSTGFDLAALEPSGTVLVEDLDPAVVARLIPQTAQSVGLLGRGKMRLDARNRTDRGALVAEFKLDAAAVDASGTVSYGPNAIAASELVVDATLTQEALASLDLGEQTELEPGARISLRAPVLALARSGEEWSPSGDLAVRTVIEGIRIRRAPGLAAPLAIARIDASASYAFAGERATANGRATLGAAGSDGDLDFRLVWQKPAAARLFGGAEGSVELSKFDLARLEPVFGLEQGAYSGILGGAGTLKVAFEEKDAPTGTVSLAFPKTQGELTLSAPVEGASRIARVRGQIASDIAPDVVARLAGLERDAQRRVTEAVRVDARIASLAVPLDAGFRPIPAEASVELTAALTPVTLEITDARGKKSIISTGSLSIGARSARLTDEISLKVTGTPVAAEAASAIDVDARVRGALSADPAKPAAPVVDGTLRATRFPAAAADAFAGTGGAIARYIGDAIDAKVDAASLSKSGGTLSADLKGEFASITAPSVAIAEGLLTIGNDKPVVVKVTPSKAVRDDLLASIHPVFRDVMIGANGGAPIDLTIRRLSYPLDGNRKRLDGEFALVTGDVELVPSGLVSALLFAADPGSPGTLSVHIDPLEAKIAKGRLTYRDFAMHAGRTQSGQWRNSLNFTGDIDLASKPVRLNSVSTTVPLSDASNWSKDAREFFDRLGAANAELVRTLAVGVEFFGPIFDPAGKPVKPERRLKLPEFDDIVRDNPGAILDAAGSIFDLFNKDDSKQADKSKQPSKPKSQQQQQPKKKKPTEPDGGRPGGTGGGASDQPASPPAKP